MNTERVQSKVICFLLGVSLASETPGKHPKENILHLMHGESL
jgi:hypothetical protein